MKLIMKEHYRDAQNYFAQGDEIEVSGTLAQWLIDNGKAVKIAEPVKEPIKEEAENGKTRKTKLDNSG